ncbi:MAG: hypothetical protein CMO55_15085 [Verrucomicrobiales bacterium]|nr:hypothetical protein [Verrucomicrobiales bacterium]
MDIIPNLTRKEVLNLEPRGSNQSQNINNEVLTTKELADRLSVSERTIYNWRSFGRIPRIGFGNVVRFILGDVIKALKDEEWRDGIGNSISYEVLNTKQLAKRLSVSERTIYNWRLSRLIPEFGDGGVVRFIYSDVLNALRKGGAA